MVAPLIGGGNMNKEYWQRLLDCEQVTRFSVSLHIETPLEGDGSEFIPKEIAPSFRYLGRSKEDEGDDGWRYHVWGARLLREDMLKVLDAYCYCEHEHDDDTYFEEEQVPTSIGERRLTCLEFHGSVGGVYLHDVRIGIMPEIENIDAPLLEQIGRAHV